MSTNATESQATGIQWVPLYRVGSIAAFVIAVLLIGEVAVYAVYSRPPTAADHFRLFQTDPLAGLLTLDLLGMIAYLLFVPTMLALHMALRAVKPVLVLVGTAFFFVGIADFFATNNAFAVLELSRQYASAPSESERLMYLAAGQAMFTLFNENAFLLSYAVVSGSWVLVSLAMLPSDTFGRATAYWGVVAGGSGMAAVVLEHIPMRGAVPVAIGIYFAAIVSLFVWTILIALCLHRLGWMVARPEREP